MDIIELNFLNRIENEENEMDNVKDLKYDMDEFKEFHAELNSKMRLLKVLHLNIRSAQKNFDSFLTFIEAFQLQDLDITIFGEIRNIADVKNFTIPGYQTVYNNSTIKMMGCLFSLRIT